MLMLQAGWLAGRLHIWGEVSPQEQSDTPPALAPRRARCLPELEELPATPYDAGAALLGQVTSALAQSKAAQRSRHARPGVVWLPSHNQAPIPAHTGFLPPDRAIPDPASAKLTLQPWRTTHLPLSWPESCAVLAAAVRGPVLGRRLHIGRSLLVWSHLWRLAGALVARQAYLPGLQLNPDGSGDSLWRMLLDSDDRRLVEQLAATLPPAAVALTCDGKTMPPAVTDPVARQAVALEFIAEAVDRLVRSAVTTPLTRAQALKSQHSGAHAAWIASLRTDGRRIRWSGSDDLAQLAAALEAWRRPLTLGQDEVLRLHFHLEEPAADAQERHAIWHLQIGVTSTSQPDPVPLTQLDQVAPLNREYALTALGQAIALCPCLRSNDAATLTAEGIPLKTEAAYNFMAQDVAVLRAAGFVVSVPKWWRDPQQENPVRLRVLLETAQDDPDSFARLGLDQLAAVNWSLVLGGHPISPDQLKELLESQQPLVRWQGGWVALDRAAALGAIRELRERRKKRISLRELLQIAVGGERADDLRLETGDLAQHNLLGNLIGQLHGSEGIAQPEVSQHFVGTLRPYQLRGYAWLAWLRQWGLGACLADDMGLGKTIQALALFQQAHDDGLERPILLVCPLSLIANWRHEATRFTPNLSLLTHYGPDRDLGQALIRSAGQHTVVITSFNLLCRDFATLSRIHWSMVVLDEAQNIKNPATLQSRAARALKADFRLALTGTPVENQVGDLWALMDFLNPGLLGTRAQFNRRFQRPIRTGVDAGARLALRQMTTPFILRRLKYDPEIVADLPERVENKVFCSLTAEQAALYAAELRRLDSGLGSAEGIARRGLVLATLTRLKQICNHPAHYLHGLGDDGEDGSIAPEAHRLDAQRSGKLARFDTLVDEVIAGNESALVFTQYAVMGTLLQKYLRQRLGYEIPFLHGGVARDARTNMIDRFQSGSGPPIFILSLKAGGIGLNLTRANHVFHFDRWWNPAVENQATDRVHRIGQTRNVFVHKFICSGTLEARIDALIESKSSLAEDLVGSGESWLTELSNEKLREVLSLSADVLSSDDSQEEWQ